MIKNNQFMKVLLVCLMASVYSSAGIMAQANIESVFKLKWKTKIGLTSYRTNIIYHKGMVVVGSNGQERNATDDDQDGVYIINAKTGKIVRHILPTQGDDQDVNGVAIAQKKLFFGSDHNRFYCYSLKGKKLWEYTTFATQGKAQGDVEGCPVLAKLNGDKYLDPVFLVEGVGLVALDGKTGKELWKYTYMHGEGAFMASPVVYDANKDGTPDVIFGGKGKATNRNSYGNYFFALNGKNGQELWKKPVYSGHKTSPILVKQGRETYLVAAESYSDVHFLDPSNGKRLRYINLNEFDGGISGLYSSPIISPKGSLIIGSAWWGKNDGVWVTPTQPKHFVNDRNGDKVLKKNQRKFYKAGRVSSSAFVADVLGKKAYQLGICTEGGELLLFDEQGGLLKRFKLPSGVEAMPLVKDIDRNRKLNILVAGYDGYLYCYEAPKKRGRVFWGQFRGDNTNQAIVKIKK